MQNEYPPGFRYMVPAQVRKTAPYGSAEECCICARDTVYWHIAKDVPLCPHCAAVTDVHAVPTKREWLTAHGFTLPKDWTPVTTGEHTQ